MRIPFRATSALLCTLALLACSDGEKATTAEGSPREAGMEPVNDTSPGYSTPGTGGALSDTMRAAPGSGSDTLSRSGKAAQGQTPRGQTARDSARRP